MTSWGTQFGGVPVGTPAAKTESSNWGSQFGGVPTGGSSERGLGASALRQVGRLGRAAVTGITGIADIPNLAAMGLHAAGLKKTPTFYEPRAGKVQQSIDSLTGGSLKPENKTEEYVDMISEGLAPMALTGGTSLTGSAARGLSKTGAKLPIRIAQATLASPEPTAANIAQSVGSSAALQAYLDEGGDPGLLGPLLASMAGGMGARGTFAAAKNAPKLKNPLNAAAEGIGRATMFSPEKYAQNKELGLPMSLASVSNSMVPTYGELAAAKIPGSMGPLEKFHKKREAAIARNLGVSSPDDLEKAASNTHKYLAKEGAKGYHERASNIFERRNEKFKPREEIAIKNKETIDISDLIQKLEEKRDKRVSPYAKSDFDTKNKDGILLQKLREYSEPSEKKVQADLIRKELSQIKTPEDIINKTIKSELGEIPSSKTTIGLEDLNDLREKALDESKTLKAPLGEGTTESRNAGIRYGELSKKRQQFIEEVGTPTEVHNARQARKFWSQYKDEKNGMSKYVAKITGTDSNEQAFTKLLSKDPKYLRVARQGLSNEGRKALDQSIIGELGSRQGRFNINTAHTNFLKKGDEFKNEYLKGLPSKASRNNFESVMDLIGDNKRMMEKLANTSNTAHTKTFINEMKKYGSAAVIAATKFDPTVLLGLVLTNASLNAGAKIWTSQKFLRRVNDVIKANSKRGKANKLDMLLKTIEQTGVHSKHIDNSYAKGGHIKELAAKGRYGDTEIAEIGPHTARFLDYLIHDGHKEINPNTGLREYPPVTGKRKHEDTESPWGEATEYDDFFPAQTPLPQPPPQSLPPPSLWGRSFPAVEYSPEISNAGATEWSPNFSPDASFSIGQRNQQHLTNSTPFTNQTPPPFQTPLPIKPTRPSGPLKTILPVPASWAPQIGMKKPIHDTVYQNHIFHTNEQDPMKKDAAILNHVIKKAQERYFDKQVTENHIYPIDDQGITSFNQFQGRNQSQLNAGKPVLLPAQGGIAEPYKTVYDQNSGDVDVYRAPLGSGFGAMLGAGSGPGAPPNFGPNKPIYHLGKALHEDLNMWDHLGRFPTVFGFRDKF